VKSFRANRELQSGLALLAFALAYVALAFRYPVETLDNPGPGIFPRAVGAFLTLVAAWLILRACWALPKGAADSSRAPAEAGAGSSGSSPTGSRPFLMIGLLVGYLLATPWVGFYTCTGLLILAVSKLMNVPGWVRPLVLALGILVCSYALFQGWLKVPFPRGYLF
jgi:hypothetical protein